MDLEPMIADLFFIVDLNEVERDGTVSVFLDFTSNYGPYVSAPVRDVPVVGSMIHVIDDADSTYVAEIMRVDNSREMTVRIDWASENTQINRSVDSKEFFVFVSGDSTNYRATFGDESKSPPSESKTRTDYYTVS